MSEDPKGRGIPGPEGCGDAPALLTASVGYTCRSHGVQVALITLISMVQAMTYNLLPVFEPCAAASFSLSLSDVALIPVMGFVAAAVAGPCFGYMGDTLGRRPVIWISAGVSAIGLGLISYSSSFAWLSVATVITGIGSSDYMTTVAMLTETSPTDVRGRIANLTNVMFALAPLLVFLTGWAVMPGGGDSASDGDWRVVAGVCALVGVAIVIAAYCMLRESPLWLLTRGRDAEARALLESTARTNGRSLDDGDFEALRSAARPARAWSVELLAIWRAPKLRARALLHWTHWLLQGFVGVGSVLFTSGLFSGVAEAEGQQCRFDWPAQVAIASSELPAGLFCHLLIDRPWGPFGWLGGRKGAQAVPFLINAVAVLLVALDLPRSTLLALAILCRFMQAAGSSASFVAAPELYPTSVRATGANAAFVLTSVGRILSAPWVYAAGLSRMAVGGGLCAAYVGRLVLALLLPETAGVLKIEMETAGGVGEVGEVGDERTLPPLRSSGESEATAYGTFEKKP